MADLKNIKGFSELDTFLQQLAPKVERNVVRGGLRAGARVFRNRARANVQRRSGATANSIKVGTRSQGGAVIAYVRVGSHKGTWLEYGTRAHQITPKNRKALRIGTGFAASASHPGERPYPFMRPAMDQGANEAIVVAGEYMKQRLATKEGLNTSDVVIGVEE